MTTKAIAARWRASRRIAAMVSALLLLPFSGDLSADQNPPQKKAAPAKKAQAPGPLEKLLRDAQQALDNEDFPTAAKALEEYLPYRPNDPIAHFQLGYAYTGMNRPEDAEREYLKAIELDSKMAEAHLNLGLLHLDGDPAASIPHLEKAAELKPTEARPRFLLGMAYERSGNNAKAIENYIAARDLDAKNFDIHFFLARVLFVNGRAAEAEPEFRAALALKSDSTSAWLGLAECLLAEGKRAEAAEQYAAYLKVEPEDNGTRMQLGGLYLDLGKNEEALAEFQRLEADGAGSARLYELLAEAYVRLKKYAEAAVSLEKAIELTPSNPALYGELGRVRLQLRDFPAAEKALLTALRLQPNSKDALRDLVAVYSISDNCPAALSTLQQLGQLETLNAGSWFIRALCYDKLAKKPEALAAYQEFLRLDQGRSEKQEFQARQRIKVLTRELERKR